MAAVTGHRPRLLVLDEPCCHVCGSETGTPHADDCEIRRVAEIVDGSPEPRFWQARCEICPWVIEAPFHNPFEANAATVDHYVRAHGGRLAG